MKDEDIKLPPFPGLATAKNWIEAIENYGRAAVRLNFPLPAPGLYYSASAKIPGIGSICVHAESAEGAELALSTLQGPAHPAPQPRPFDLEAAKAGAPLVTRDGRKARFLAHVPEARSDCRVVAYIEGESGMREFPESGAARKHTGPNGDLFMAPKPKRTVWVNFYPGFAASYFGGEEIAKKGAERDCIAVAVPIEIDA